MRWIFFAFEVQELVGRDVIRKDVTAVGLEHGREDDAMEDDVVLSDEVYHLGLLVFPIFFPLRRELLGRRDIAYRCVEPYVENLSLGPSTGTGMPS